ncbi:uncharacterized protein LOC143027842 [Oratosquilla oratoria]|uniref:uncharacterized protein LOC143027842 n=1 Tax=Oratosquilla oratoria TaxID=337810 RepID=UPI003F762213
MYVRIYRAGPAVQAMLRRAPRNATLALHGYRPSCVVNTRSMYGWGRRDPFAQMEEFMKDMEKKFKRSVEDTLEMLPKEFVPPGSAMTTTKTPRFGQPVDVSTPEMYVISFNFKNASAENIKVTLKEKTLSVQGKIEEVTETSRSCQDVTHEFEIPEDVDLEALESSLSNEGILTIQAPFNTPQAPQQITIERE